MPTSSPEIQLSDRSVLASAAARLSVPRVDIPPGMYSFVLHAPLELLARGTLLPYVRTEAREQARARIDTLAANYDQITSLGDATAIAFSSPQAALEALLQAIVDRDPILVDGSAAWLDAHASAADIARAVAPYALPALAAAGHANIYIGLLGSVGRAGDLSPMLRSVAHSLVSDPSEPLPVPPVRREESATARLLGVLSRLGGGERGPLSFIAPLVHDAHGRGVLDQLCEPDGVFTAPVQPPVELLRVAAYAMLQGPTEYAAYGWTHCLTLAQGALRAGAWAADLGTGAYMAAAYIAAHVATYADQPIDLDYQPEPTPLPLDDALRDSPAAAASAAWYAPEQATTALATSASVNHDAHRVKYTLACIEAAAEDPGYGRLYLAAAAHLNAWWEEHPDESDPV